MLTRKVRRVLDNAFYNYIANVEQGSEDIEDILSRNMTRGLCPQNRTNARHSPTEQAALELASRNEHYRWAKVVDITLEHFKWTNSLEFKIIPVYYKKRKNKKEVYNTFFAHNYDPHSAWWFHRERWLKIAHMAAKEYKLL